MNHIEGCLSIWNRLAEFNTEADSWRFGIRRKHTTMLKNLLQEQDTLPNDYEELI